MRSKSLLYGEEFEDLEDAEYIEFMAAKQLKRFKAQIREGSQKKKTEIRKKRKQKESVKENAFKVEPER